MAGLFTPILRHETAEAAFYSIALDVEEPYLDDHRPGEYPLFSTVMGIEALVAAARRCGGDGLDPALREVRVLKPYIAMSAGPHAVEVAIRSAAGPLTPDAGRFDAALRSVAADGAVVEHLHAQIEFAAPAVPAAPSGFAARATGASAETVATPHAGQDIGADDIYRLFFHGPAFRVVGRAQYREGRIQCQLAPELPPSHRGQSGLSEMAPRLIEFALQSAGLLELAASGRMMIPHSISAVERYRPIDVDYPGAIFATAAFDAEDPAAISIDVADERGCRVLRVSRYRTEPPPFLVNAIACSQLRELLSRDR